MRLDIFFLMLIGVLLSSISQVLLKKSANKADEKKEFLAQYLNPYVISGYGLLALAMLIPFFTYRFIDLKYGAVIESLGYGFVMVLSRLVFGEKITKRKLAGNLIIIAGVVIFNLGSG